MPQPLRAQLHECGRAILTAIADGLRERADYIAAIPRTSNGQVPVTGIALELSPWHGAFALSLRLSSDFPIGKNRYNSADWTHFAFTEGCRSPSIAKVGAIISDFYQQGQEPHTELHEMAHLIFLAGAEVLLDPAACNILREFGVDAPLLEGGFVATHFQYILTDPDETMKSNYCDIVLSNRMTKRLLGQQL
jgi:hypothetical protein